MSKVYPFLNNFNTGEVSPLFQNRSDIAKFNGACRKLENFIVLPQGPVRRRPGTYYVSSVKTSSKKVRLVSFEFSTVQAYIIEFGNLYCRFYKDSGQITTGGGSAYEITTPYLEADLYQLKMTQSADTLYIVHPDYPPKKLTRTGHTSWTLVDFVAKNGTATAITAATKANPCKITSTAHGLINDDIIHITDVVGMTEINDAFYVITKVDDDNFSLNGVNSTAYTAYTSGGTVQKSKFGVTNNNPSAVAFFEERIMMAGTITNPQKVYGSWSGDYENFILDSTDASAGLEYTILSDKVDAIRWMVGQDYLAIGTVGGVWRMGASSKDDPLTMDDVIAKRQVSIGCKDMDAELVNNIIVYVQRGGNSLRSYQYSFDIDKWVSPDLTILSEHIARGDTSALSGVIDMDYQQEPIGIIWCVRADGQLLAMTYEPDQQVWGWSRMVTDGEVESVAVLGVDDTENQVWISVKRTIGTTTSRYIEYFKPHNFWGQIEDCFFVDSGLTYDGGAAVNITNITKANPAVVAAPGHSFTNGDKIRISDVAGMTEANQSRSEAYTVAGAVAGVSFQLSGINSTGWTAYSSGGTAQKVAKTVSGLSHLEGETVSILADGAVVPDKVVSSGSIILDWYGNKIHAGLPYDSIIKPMRIEIGSGDGTSYGKKKRITELVVSFYESWGAKWGDSESNLTVVPFGLGDIPALYTGDKEYSMSGDYTTQADIVIVQDMPLPCTILSIVPKVGLYG